MAALGNSHDVLMLTYPAEELPQDLKTRTSSRKIRDPIPHQLHRNRQNQKTKNAIDGSDRVWPQARHQWSSVAELVTEFDETLAPVECLSGEISQVLLNLIVNAAHAIQTSGKDLR